MKITQTLVALFAVTAVAHPQVFQRDPQRNSILRGGANSISNNGNTFVDNRLNRGGNNNDAAADAADNADNADTAEDSSNNGDNSNNNELSQNGDSVESGGVTQTLICTKIQQSGGDVGVVPCENGEDGCTCRNSFTVVSCFRAVQDGTGGVSLESCDQSEEGVDRCECNNTPATQNVERCTRAVQDGTGGVSVENCDKSEEGVDRCECNNVPEFLSSLP